MQRMTSRDGLLQGRENARKEFLSQETPGYTAKRRYTVLDGNQVRRMQECEAELMAAGELNATQIHASLAATFNVASSTVRKQLFETDWSDMPRRGPGRPRLLRDIEGTVFEECREWIKKCNLPPTMPYLRLIVSHSVSYRCISSSF